MTKLLDIKRLKSDYLYRTVVLTAISGVFLVISWFGWLKGILPFDIAWMSIIISGTPIIRIAATGLFTKFDITAGVLVSIALVASVIIGEYFAAGEIAFIMMLGEILESRTVRKSREGLKRLVQLTPKTATVRRPEGDVTISAELVKAGDIILVKPGESIPVDGIVMDGQSSVNQSIITGESIPIDKSEGDEVFIGTMNQMGFLTVKATKVGEDTSLSKLIMLVKESEKKKAPVVRLADRWATFIVPAALALSIITYIVTRDITRAVTILVVFCPCALVLATPTAITAGIGNASRRGFIVKSGEALETLAQADTVAFDKTGTITCGRPEVADIVSFKQDYDEDGILRIAASAEKFSGHPLGEAVIRMAQRRSLIIEDPERFAIKPGYGVTAFIGSKRILAGNRKLMQAENVPISDEVLKSADDFENSGKTVMMVVEDNEVAGLISIADKIKPGTKNAVAELYKMGIKNILLLTGDNEKTAMHIAQEAGIRKVYAEKLPGGKVEVIRQLMDGGDKVCMIGDGINDAPALAAASTGIAMGALGADVAVETADIALMSDDISKIPGLFALSRKVLNTVIINIIISMLINFAAILLAAAGILDPVAGALVHNVGSVLVVANSASLIRHGLPTRPGRRELRAVDGRGGIT